MSDQFVAEIRIFACNFAPVGWALCNGQLLPISQNTALFSLIGTYYGGNGTSNFALPNFQGRAALCQGNGPGLTPRNLGETDGTENETLLLSQLPTHSHAINCSNTTGSSPSPGGNVLAASGIDRNLVMYNNATSGGIMTMNPAQLSISGSGQPHNNMSPYLTLNFCIALQGIYPARN